MKNKQNGFVAVLLIALVALAAAGSLYIHYKGIPSLNTNADTNLSSTALPQTQPSIQTESQVGTIVSIKGVGTGIADDAEIMLDLSQLRMSAEFYNQKNNYAGYKGFCTDTSNQSDTSWLEIAAKDVGGNKGIMCKDSESAYVVAVALNSGAYGCIDSQGNLKKDLAAFPTSLQCSGVTFKPVQFSTIQSSTTIQSAASGSSSSFNATIVGGTLSVADRNAIIAGSMNAVAILNSGDVALFKQYAAKTLPPERLTYLNSMTDSQIATLMKSAGKIALQDTSTSTLSSANATWTVLDSNHVEINIQFNSGIRSVIDAARIDGVWY